MSQHSDFITATRLSAVTPANVREAQIQTVFEDQSLSLKARGLYVLLAEQPGAAIDLFDDLMDKAESMHGAIEELIAAGLVRRV